MSAPKVHFVDPVRGRANVYSAWTLCGITARSCYATVKHGDVTCPKCRMVLTPDMSDKPKWTPGPWRADWDDNGQWYIEPLAVTGTKLRGDSGDCLERSNAHLIAAAPDLYKALEAINAHWEAGNFSRNADLWDPMRAALAKARGEKV